MQTFRVTYRDQYDTHRTFTVEAVDLKEATELAVAWKGFAFTIHIVSVHAVN